MKKVFGTFAAVLIGCIALILSLVLVTALVSTVNPFDSQDDEEDQNQEPITCSPGSGAENIPEEYRDLVFEAAKISGLDPAIHAAQIDQESSWNPEAQSPAGAKGIAQFLDATWKEQGQGGDVWDPKDAIPAQGRYMKWIEKYLTDNGFSGAENMLELTLAGYNAGIGTVVASGGIPNNAETQEYVKKIPALAQSKYKDACVPIDTEDNDVEFVNSGKWSSPLPGAGITSGYGRRTCPTGNCTEDAMNHQGIDLAIGGNANVLAPADMEVTFAGGNDYWAQWYGTWIIGKQIGGEEFVFEFHHCKPGSLKVKTGKKVAAGTALCTEGRSGNATGVHLHFQIGKPGIDPTQPTRRKTLDPKPILVNKKVL